MSLSADVYRDRGDVRCPSCFGIPDIVEEHRPAPGVIIRILHACGTCLGRGRITRTSSRAFWAAKPPTA